jgi:hypothetical protein
LTVAQRGKFIVARAHGRELDPLPDNGNSYDYRAIISYSEAKKVAPLDLTVREYQQFARV